MPLSDRDLAILAFEKRYYRYPGHKAQDVLKEFGMSEARYFQVVSAIIDTPEAELLEPQLVRRLWRIRDNAFHARTGIGHLPRRL